MTILTNLRGLGKESDIKSLKLIYMYIRNQWYEVFPFFLFTRQSPTNYFNSLISLLNMKFSVSLLVAATALFGSVEAHC